MSSVQFRPEALFLYGITTRNGLDMSKNSTEKFITNDKGQFWSWSMRRWINEKRPVMGAEIEMRMAIISDPSARIMS